MKKIAVIILFIHTGISISAKRPGLNYDFYSLIYERNFYTLYDAGNDYSYNGLNAWGFERTKNYYSNLNWGYGLYYAPVGYGKEIEGAEKEYRFHSIKIPFSIGLSHWLGDNESILVYSNVGPYASFLFSKSLSPNKFDYGGRFKAGISLGGIDFAFVANKSFNNIDGIDSGSIDNYFVSYGFSIGINLPNKNEKLTGTEIRNYYRKKAKRSRRQNP